MSIDFNDQFTDIESKSLSRSEIQKDTVLNDTLKESLQNSYKSFGPYQLINYKCDNTNCANGVYVGNLIILDRVKNQRVDKYGFKSADGEIITGITSRKQSEFRSTGWAAGAVAILTVVDEDTRIHLFSGTLDKVIETALPSILDEYYRSLRYSINHARLLEIFNSLPIEHVDYEHDKNIEQEYRHSSKFRLALNPKTHNYFQTIGYIRREPDNTNDSFAVVVYDYENNKVGYIYRTQQEAYYKICNSKDIYPCVITTYPGPNNKRYGDCYVFPRNEFIVSSISTLLEWCEECRNREQAFRPSNRPPRVLSDDEIIQKAIADAETKEGSNWGCLWFLLIFIGVPYLLYLFYKYIVFS